MTPSERAKDFVDKYKDSHVWFVSSRLEELLEQVEADAIQRTKEEYGIGINEHHAYTLYEQGVVHGIQRTREAIRDRLNRLAETVTDNQTKRIIAACAQRCMTVEVK